MGFFTEFNTWLNGLLTTYISQNTSLIATALEPAIVTLGTVYVMIWGYLNLTGQVQEPVVDGVKRLSALALILGVALHLWLYNALIVDTFFNAPTALAAAIVGSYNPVSLVDDILNSGADTAELLLRKGGLLSGNVSYALAGLLVYVVIGITAVYTMFLLLLSRIALSVLLALGPLFFALLLFESTKRFFEAWLAQLANYALITILTVLVAALMLGLVRTVAQQAATIGGGIQIAQAMRVCLTAGLTFLVMRQVMPMAAGLASGLSLSSFGVVSATALWALRSAQRGGGQFVRGLTDRDTSRWDPLSRKAGYYTRRGVVAGARKVFKRPNEIRA
jgi:type IV secretion system protein VirB6